MATPKQTAADFEEIIQRGRRIKAQQLANQMFGRRAASGSGINAPRKPGTGPSLASRIGVAKRSASQSSLNQAKPQPRAARKPAGNVQAEWTHDLHEDSSTSTGRGARNNNRGVQGRRADVLEKAFNGTGPSSAVSNQVNVVSTSKKSFSIRGLAGPCVVVAENFAPGTSAADIENAMAPFAGSGLRCTIIRSGAIVAAELDFETREDADNVIANFHNQVADGRVLRLYYKPSTPTSITRASNAPISAPTGPRADTTNGRYGATDRYTPRGRSDDRPTEKRAEVVDGSYGFDERMDTDEPEPAKPLYSDNLVDRRGGQYQGRPRGGQGGYRGNQRGRR